MKPFPLLSASALALALAACTPPTPAADAAATPATTAPASQPAATPQAPAITPASGTYVIDPTHTMVLAQWNHFGFSNPSANFGDAKGEIRINAEDMSQSSVTVTLPLSGLSSFSKAFDEHLAKSDFFDVARFPEARFASTKVEPLGGNRYAVTGDLTLKDKTLPVTLEATLNGAGNHPMKNVPTLGFDATARIKRSDFGLGLHAPHVGDEVSLRITTEASQAPAQ